MVVRREERSIVNRVRRELSGPETLRDPERCHTCERGRFPVHIHKSSFTPTFISSTKIEFTSIRAATVCFPIVLRYEHFICSSSCQAATVAEDLSAGLARVLHKARQQEVHLPYNNTPPGNTNS